MVCTQAHRPGASTLDGVATRTTIPRAALAASRGPDNSSSNNLATSAVQNAGLLSDLQLQPHRHPLRQLPGIRTPDQQGKCPTPPEGTTKLREQKKPRG